MDIQEILSQPDGFTPPEVTVTIDKVYERKSGEGEYGPWSFQTLQVNGGRLKLKNVEAVGQDRAGQTVTLRANHSKQHGLTGLSVNHEKYKDKVYDQIVVTGSAKWEWQNGSPNGNGHQPQSRVEYDAPPKYDGERFKAHLLGCADIAAELFGVLSLQDDQAKQACFATVCIDAQRHNVILSGEPGAAETENEAGRREALMKGVQSACKLLNEEGYEPPFTRGTLDAYANEQFKIQGGVANLSLPNVEELIKKLSDLLDAFRANSAMFDEPQEPLEDPPF